MQFKHPEFLYALFLLLIPIVVHLFQFRRFKKELFTNVKFLKRVQFQTRKSSKLKKWLILLARLAALAFIILAFAQPFIPRSESALREKQTIVYIDNSFSMQQKSDKGELLKQAIQQLAQTFPEDQPLRILTNDQTFEEESLKNIKNDLLQLDYSPEEVSLNQIWLRAKESFSRNQDAEKQFIAISDFQEINLKEIPDFDQDTRVHFLQLRGKKEINYSIDSVYLRQEPPHSAEIEVLVSADKKTEEMLPVSLYSGDKLLSKSSVRFKNDTLAKLRFSISDDLESLNGRLEIEDNQLEFDNTYYFSIQSLDKIRVVALSETAETAEFLPKLFGEPEFDLKSITTENPDYTLFENANFIVLNELKIIPDGMEAILKKHLVEGGSLVIIPDEKSDLTGYNRLLNQLSAGDLSPYSEGEMLITSINYAHPLFANVFENRVTNFHYPKVKGGFTYSGQLPSALSFNNGKAFLSGNDQVFIFSAPLHSGQSNFKRSPLIVPVFYNMARQSLQLPRLSYTIGAENRVELPLNLGSDEVVSLKNEAEEFIPRQRRFGQKLEILLDELPDKAGLYQLIKEDENIGSLSFNYNRKENSLQFSDLTEFSNAEVSSDITEFFTKQIEKERIDQFWKSFLIFGLLFLLIEVVLVRFLK